MCVQRAILHSKPSRHQRAKTVNKQFKISGRETSLQSDHLFGSVFQNQSLPTRSSTRCSTIGLRIFTLLSASMGVDRHMVDRGTCSLPTLLRIRGDDKSLPPPLLLVNKWDFWQLIFEINKTICYQNELIVKLNIWLNCQNWFYKTWNVISARRALPPPCARYFYHQIDPFGGVRWPYDDMAKAIPNLYLEIHVVSKIRYEISLVFWSFVFTRYRSNIFKAWWNFLHKISYNFTLFMTVKKIATRLRFDRVILRHSVFRRLEKPLLHFTLLYCKTQLKNLSLYSKLGCPYLPRIIFWPC